MRQRTAEGPGLVGAAPTLDIPLRSDIVFLVERRRALLRKAHTATTEKWCLSFRR